MDQRAHKGLLINIREEDVDDGGGLSQGDAGKAQRKGGRFLNCRHLVGCLVLWYVGLMFKQVGPREYLECWSTIWDFGNKNLEDKKNRVYYGRGEGLFLQAAVRGCRSTGNRCKGPILGDWLAASDGVVSCLFQRQSET